MQKKHAIMVDLGYYYNTNIGFDSLPYVYDDVNLLTNKLQQSNWIVPASIPDRFATKEAILNNLEEKINLLEDGDWLLFFYAGHGYSTSPYKSMCLVTFDEGLNIHNQPTSPYPSFFNNVDYLNIIQKFQSKSPTGHMITILNCCNAFGLISNYNKSERFHSVFCAAEADKKSPVVSDKSIFFPLLSQVWDDNSFEEMDTHLTNLIESSDCYGVVKIASNFKTYKF